MTNLLYYVVGDVNPPSFDELEYVAVSEHPMMWCPSVMVITTSCGARSTMRTLSWGKPVHLVQTILFVPGQ